MKKTDPQLEKEYPKGVIFLVGYINADFMDWFGSEDCPNKGYADLALSHAEDRARLGEIGVRHYLQTITDLQSMAKKEMDSWEVITHMANTWMPDAAATKNWLEKDVIPVLEAEGRKRGWIK